ncbi:Zinc finger protein [Gryllus bimaculatus]|nr:Zinc finger protein [Gryllus bimaculatus]
MCSRRSRCDAGFVVPYSQMRTKVPVLSSSTSQGRIVCNHCQRIFCNRNALRRHLRHNNSDNISPIHQHNFIVEEKKIENFNMFNRPWIGVLSMCPQCGRAYRRRDTMLRHLARECQRDPQLACVVCSRRFYHEHHRQNHMRRVHGLDALAFTLSATAVLQPSPHTSPQLL